MRNPDSLYSPTQFQADTRRECKSGTSNQQRDHRCTKQSVARAEARLALYTYKQATVQGRTSALVCWHSATRHWTISHTYRHTTSISSRYCNGFRLRTRGYRISRRLNIDAAYHARTRTVTRHLYWYSNDNPGDIAYSNAYNTGKISATGHLEQQSVSHHYSRTAHVRLRFCAGFCQYSRSNNHAGIKS